MRGERRRSSLTQREREVLGLVRVGLTNEEIAERLGISSDTAKFHVSQILAKLGVATREKAALAVLEERGWRERLGGLALAAKVGLAAAAVAAIGGIGLLAWGMATSGTGDSPATYAGEIGTFEDKNGFVTFAAEMAHAVETNDTRWFMDNSVTQCAAEDVAGCIPCVEGSVESCIESLPDNSEAILGHTLCVGEPAELCNQGVGRGVTLDLYQQDGSGSLSTLVGGDYRNFLTAILQSTDAPADEFGAATARLHAVGIRGGVEDVPGNGTSLDFLTIRGGGDGSQPGEYEMQSIVTAVPYHPVSFSSAPDGVIQGRVALIFDALFLQNREWVIVGLSVAPADNDSGISLAEALTPTSATPLPGIPAWHYWQRWPVAPNN
jgi:DNA-binding CsgD family transcriptional regulator